MHLDSLSLSLILLGVTGKRHPSGSRDGRANRPAKPDFRRAGLFLNANRYHYMNSNNSQYARSICGRCASPGFFHRAILPFGFG
jgi:hypothetical protein